MSGTLTAAHEGVREGAVRVFVCVWGGGLVVYMPTCIRTDEGEGGRITDDLLIGLG